MPAYVLTAPTVVIGDPTKASDHNKLKTDLSSHTHDGVNTAAVDVVQSGLDAAKDASPVVGEIYVATDANKTYVCTTAGAWTALLTSVSPLEQDWDVGNQSISGLSYIAEDGTPATAGFIRMQKGSSVQSRNAADDGNVQLIALTSSGDLVEVGPSSGIQIDTSGNLSTGGVTPDTNYELLVNDQAKISDALVIPVGTDKWATTA